MDKNIAKVYIASIQKSVWQKEREHRRRIKTPTAYRYGKHWASSSGKNMELLKVIYNSGLTEKSFNLKKGGIQHGFLIG